MVWVQEPALAMEAMPVVAEPVNEAIELPRSVVVAMVLSVILAALMMGRSLRVKERTLMPHKLL